MIISCPACKTRYVVPDNAIGVEGRTVRCAKCRHSWFQDGPMVIKAAMTVQPGMPNQGIPQPHFTQPVPETPPAPQVQPAPPPQAAPEPVATAEEQPEPQPVSPQPVSPPPAAPEPDAPSPVFHREEDSFESEAPPRFAESASQRAAARYDDTEPQYQYSRSSFEHEPPFRPRRNVLKIATYAAVVFALVISAAIAAVTWYGLPDWVPFGNQTFAEGEADLQLDFPPNRLDRRTLPNGTEFFGASGKVTNVGKERHSVPPILIVLRDGHDRIVYSWEVIAPKHQLNPGESVTINEAVLDVPKTAKFAEVGWKPD